MNYGSSPSFSTKRYICQLIHDTVLHLLRLLGMILLYCILFINQGFIPTNRGQYVALSAAAMHELGHSIGLSNVDFEGIDNTS